MNESTPFARLECSSCGGNSFSPDPRGMMICDFCQAVYVLPENACPECGAQCDPEARYCPACGADLVHECRSCGAPNPHSAEKCTKCGQDLDFLQVLFARASQQRSDWLDELREDASDIKVQQEAASQARLAEMWTVERQRRQELAEARAERDRQQRIILTVLGVVIAIIVVGVFISIAVSLTQPPESLYPF
ncbi:MAG: zinc-ribbon domain-containing protein [Chloroflexi bacterium]|nr:zinc-ribbon domain-containing protein [Chloroflexota bacterium]